MASDSEVTEFQSIEIDLDSWSLPDFDTTAGVATLLRTRSCSTSSTQVPRLTSEDEYTCPSPSLSEYISHPYKSTVAVMMNAQDGNPPKERSKSGESTQRPKMPSKTCDERPETDPMVPPIKSKSHFMQSLLGRSVESTLDYFRALNAEESPKQVCSRETSSALTHFALFHLPAIIITICLLIFYLTHFRWAYSHPNPDELSALQFAAKIHEVFILASLMDIVYHRISYGLLYDKGISLGFLASPFSLGSSVQYLMSWEFWAALLYPTSNRNFNRITGILIIIVGLLGIGAGPFSATAMIPRQRWWGLRNNYTNYIHNLTGDDYLHGNPYLQKPEFLSPLRLSWCEVDSEDHCEGLKLGAKMESLQTIIEDPPTFPYFQNITYDNYDNPNNRQISFSKADNMSLILSTSPMSFIAQTFNKRYQYAGKMKLNKLLMKSQQKNGSEVSNWKQPLLSVHCDSYTSGGENPTFLFDGGFYEKYATTIKLTKSMGLLSNFTKYKSVKDLPGSPDPIILNLRNEVSIPMSTAILLGSAIKDEVKMASYQDVSDKFKMRFDLCLIHARWVEVNVWQNYQTSSTLDSSFEFASQNTLDYLRKTSTPNNMINITTEYLKSIGWSYDRVNRTEEFSNPVYQGLATKCIDFNPDNPNWSKIAVNCLTINLAFYLTNSLAQSVSSSDPDQEPTLFQNTYYEYLYGYDFQDSISLRLAFAALLSQVCFALLHLGIITLSMNPWHSSSWGSFGQMLVLALRSRTVFGLENAGGGVSSSRTWRKTVFVGEIKDEKILEMAIVDKCSSCCNKTNDQSSQRELLLRVKAGSKYG